MNSTNKLSREARIKAAESGMLPHEFLLMIARGLPIFRIETDANGVETKVREVYDFNHRMDAAKAASPYFAPKISTVEVIHAMDEPTLDDTIKRLAAETGFALAAGGESEEEGSEESESRPRQAKPRIRVD